jgi:hypothetical protein
MGNGDDAGESTLGAFRQEIRAWVAAGERLDTILARLRVAKVSDTERVLLERVARSDTRESKSVGDYRDSFDQIDG